MPKKKQTKSDNGARGLESKLEREPGAARTTIQTSISLSSGKNNPECNETKNKFGKRVIESNWAKYEQVGFKANSPASSSLEKCYRFQEDPTKEEDDTASGNEETSYGTHFQTLVSQAGRSISTFKFKEDNVIDSEQNAGQSQISKNNGPLHFDLQNAGSCLKDISMYEKLGIQRMLDLIENDGPRWHGDYLESLEGLSEGPFDDNKTYNRLSKPECFWMFDGIEQYESNIHMLLEKINSENCCEENSETGKFKEFNRKEKDIRNRPSDVTESQCRDVSLKLITQIKQESDNQKAEEDELDHLLKLDSLEMKDQCFSIDSNHEGEDATVRDEVNKSGKNDDLISIDSHDNTDEAVVKQSNQAKTDVDDLEDWLDSILE